MDLHSVGGNQNKAYQGDSNDEINFGQKEVGDLQLSGKGFRVSMADEKQENDYCTGCKKVLGKGFFFYFFV